MDNFTAPVYAFVGPTILFRPCIPGHLSPTPNGSGSTIGAAEPRLLGSARPVDESASLALEARMGVVSERTEERPAILPSPSDGALKEDPR